MKDTSSNDISFLDAANVDKTNLEWFRYPTHYGNSTTFSNSQHIEGKYVFGCISYMMEKLEQFLSFICMLLLWLKKFLTLPNCYIIFFSSSKSPLPKRKNSPVFKWHKRYYIGKKLGLGIWGGGVKLELEFSYPKFKFFHRDGKAAALFTKQQSNPVKSRYKHEADDSYSWVCPWTPTWQSSTCVKDKVIGSIVEKNIYNHEKMHEHHTSLGRGMYLCLGDIGVLPTRRVDIRRGQSTPFMILPLLFMYDKEKQDGLLAWIEISSSYARLRRRDTHSFLFLWWVNLWC